MKLKSLKRCAPAKLATRQRPCAVGRPQRSVIRMPAKSPQQLPGRHGRPFRVNHEDGHRARGCGPEPCFHVALSPAGLVYVRHRLPLDVLPGACSTGAATAALIASSAFETEPSASFTPNMSLNAESATRRLTR